MNNLIKAIFIFLKNLPSNTQKIISNSSIDALPAIHNLKDYSLSQLKSDLKSGLNLSLLAFPQGIAYASIAGLPISFGIMSSMCSTLISPFFASSRYTILGATNATAFMIFSFFSVSKYSENEKLYLISLLCLLVGALIIIGAYFNFADLIQYISHSVIVGYLTGAAILIIANQLKHTLGFSISEFAIESVNVHENTNALQEISQVKEKGKSFFTIILGVLKNSPNTHLPTLFFSVATAFTYIAFIKKYPKLPIFAISLAIMSLIAIASAKVFEFSYDKYKDFSPSMLIPKIPNFANGNALEDISAIFGLAIGVAFLASMEYSVMAKNLASKTGIKSRMNQDLLSIGISNITNSYLNGMPSSGSLTRTALNYRSGATSILSGFFSAIFCIILALLFAPLIKYIPKSALAVLVIIIALSLINAKNIKICLNATKSDAIVLISTFIASLLLPLYTAIFIGVAISIILYLRQASKPHLVEYDFNEEGNLKEKEKSAKKENPAISIVHVEGEIFFGSAEIFRNQIQEVANDPSLHVVILRMRNAHHLDATSVMALYDLLNYLNKNQKYLILSGVGPELLKVIVNSGMEKAINKENIFKNYPSNPNISTRNALIRAKELLGGKMADIKIFTTQKNNPK